jgi:hypothetical protein
VVITYPRRGSVGLSSYCSAEKKFGEPDEVLAAHARATQVVTVRGRVY